MNTKDVFDALRENPQAAGWIVAILVIFLGFLIILRILKLFEKTITSGRFSPEKTGRTSQSEGNEPRQ